MTTSASAWQGFPAVPPRGYELAVIDDDGDNLAQLERDELKRRGGGDLNQIGLEIMAANGVPHVKTKTCTWARALCAFVMARGGRRFAVDPKYPNVCEPGQGFCHFGKGFRLYLPVGLRRRAEDQPRAETPARRGISAAHVVIGLVLTVGVGGALLAKRKRKGAQ